MSSEYKSSSFNATRSRESRSLEKITLVHVGVSLLVATWYFGGGSAGARLALSWLGSLASAIFIAGVFQRHAAREADRVPLRWLWPFLGINLLVLASCLNPSFTEKFLQGESFLAQTGAAHPALPSTAHVTTSLQHLWLFDALYLTAFNLTLVTRRSGLRGLLLLAGANTVALAIFGTLQKLVADGLFFGAVPSPNTRFFATFIYGNHWAAFAVLIATAISGLLFRHLYRHDGSPAAKGRSMLGIIGIVLIAITPLIAGSRAGTLMMMLLLAVLGLRYISVLTFRRYGSYGSRALPVLGLVLAGILTAATAAWLGREALRERLTDTRSQLEGDALAGRRELYHDTWRLVKEKSAFGWGLGTYSKVFLLIRPRPLESNRQYERSYADAHSDWLQACAEVGLVGTTLLGFCATVPFFGLRLKGLGGPVTLHCLFGCGLIAAYALVEFPFGNPAVVLAWWVGLFSAAQYARLSASSRSTAGPPAVE